MCKKNHSHLDQLKRFYDKSNNAKFKVLLIFFLVFRRKFLLILDEEMDLG
jgi:hypothetical protein